MNLGPIERISPGQLFWLAFVTVVAGGVYIWPQTVVAIAGANALWAIVLSVAVAVALLWLELAWTQRVPGHVESDRLQRVWGAGAYLWTAGTLATYVLIDGSVLAIFGAMLQVFFYPNTPTWAVRAVISGLAAWLASQSLATLGRNTQFWFPWVLGSFFLLAFLAVPHLEMTGAIRPTFPPEPLPVFHGLLATWYLWTQGDIAITLSGTLRRGGWAAVRRWSTWAFVLQGGMLVLIWALVVTTLGPWASRLLVWPMPFIFVNLGPESFFIARPGVFLLSSWTVAVVLYLAARAFCLSVNIQVLSPGLQRAQRALLVLGVAGATYAVAQLLTTPAAVTDFVVRDVDPLALAFMTSRALFSWLLVSFRARPAAKA